MTYWRRFLRFNAVGGVGIGVQLAALWLLVDVMHVNYLVATPAAVALAVAHNFAWHWRWTWHDRTEDQGLAAAFVRFAGANGTVSLVVNLGVMATLMSSVHIHPVAANLVAIAICGLLNFWLGDVIVFRRV